ncbi:MAG: hypothetical protein R3A79_16485 [Nannocystaceae bacterium]
MRKIETICDRDHLRTLVNIFAKHGLGGYSVIDIAEGKGIKRGETLGISLSGTRSVLVVAACSIEQADALGPDLQAFVRRHRGIAWVTPLIDVYS